MDLFWGYIGIVIMIRWWKVTKKLLSLKQTGKVNQHVESYGTGTG